jgi:3-hydroxyacyl-CoA dehydrogenase
VAWPARAGPARSQLGLLPGAGGTQRAPRLIGAGRAGADAQRPPLGAPEALAPLVDKLGEGTDHRRRPAPMRCCWHRPRCAAAATPALADKAAAQAAIDALRAEAGKSRGLFSPLKIIDACKPPPPAL